MIKKQWFAWRIATIDPYIHSTRFFFRSSRLLRSLDSKQPFNGSQKSTTIPIFPAIYQNPTYRRFRLGPVRSETSWFTSVQESSKLFNHYIKMVGIRQNDRQFVVFSSSSSNQVLLSKIAERLPFLWSMKYLVVLGLARQSVLQVQSRLPERNLEIHKRRVSLFKVPKKSQSISWR